MEGGARLLTSWLRKAPTRRGRLARTLAPPNFYAPLAGNVLRLVFDTATLRSGSRKPRDGASRFTLTSRRAGTGASFNRRIAQRILSKNLANHLELARAN
jgi:hypothetical protein